MIFLGLSSPDDGNTLNTFTMGLTLSTRYTTESSPYDLGWVVVVKEKTEGSKVVTEEVKINPFTKVTGDGLDELSNSEVFV